jgi:glutathione S-transferase
MEFAYPLTAIGTLLIVALTFTFSFRAGQGRLKHDVPAPSVVGPDEWNRTFRVHANTIEQLILFLPVLWLFAVLVGDMHAAIAALVWVATRVVYAKAYAADASKRAPGFLGGIAVLLVIFLWTLGVLTYGLIPTAA